MTTMHAVFARKGERIICPNGHQVEQFARDVYVGEVLMPDWFVNAKFREGDDWGQCYQCDAHFVGFDMDKNDQGVLVVGHLKVLVEGEWR